MNVPKQTVVVIVAAIILFGVGIVGALAFTGGDDNSNVHEMPNGQMMTGPMHTMQDGSVMTGMDMTP